MTFQWLEVEFELLVSLLGCTGVDRHLLWRLFFHQALQMRMMTCAIKMLFM